MKKRQLAFYTRKKLNHKFTKDTFLDHKQFLKFLKEHDIDITENTLENFEKGASYFIDENGTKHYIIEARDTPKIGEQ